MLLCVIYGSEEKLSIKLVDHYNPQYFNRP